MRRAQSSGAVPAPSCGLARPLPEPTEEAVDVGHGREVLGGQALPFPGERDPLRHRHDRGADGAGIDQLLAPQSLPVGIALVLYPSVAEADEIGGGAADVDEHPALGLQRGKGGARMPVRRGHIEGVVPGPCRGDETPPPGIDRNVIAPEPSRHESDQCPHAFLAVAKAVGQLSGHGERVAMRAFAEPGGQGSEGLLEPVQALPEPARDLPDARQPTRWSSAAHLRWAPPMSQPAIMEIVTGRWAVDTSTVFLPVPIAHGAGARTWSNTPRIAAATLISTASVRARSKSNNSPNARLSKSLRAELLT